MLQNPYGSKRKYFDNGNTRSYEFRKIQLEKLKTVINKYEEDIINSLTLDLGKPIFESYTAEIGVVYQELNHAIKNLRYWMKPKKVHTPIYLQPANSYIYKEPKGIVLIISPWNYPFQLAISPLIGAIASGNCVVLKPSNQSQETEKIISKIIHEAFNDNYISVVEGPGSETVTPLMENYRFDHIFFTGSVSVGKKILEISSKYLIPVTLELGGKSPTIVHEDADINIAAKRITWAKFYNAGQTCVAPDYLLVHESQKETLINKIKLYITKYYGENIEESKNLGRIINEKRFDRLISLLKECNILEGGNYNRENRFIAPTLIDGIDTTHPIMKEEIFGPILPILTYRDIHDIVNIVRTNPYPLALYLFTENRSIENYIIENIQFGGGCINHAISHVANQNLPFGGFGYSGMGNYHSKYTFNTFSHEKSIFKSKGKLDNNILYPPYNEKNLRLARKFL
ncbi:aldehyde dehydrogenase [Tissierella praeacuta]|uniref:aldehyde dehydrogenase n=1 Tax=Tissierella praeacuta TaxID=43131 RepID=UPI0033429CD3